MSKDRSLFMSLSPFIHPFIHTKKHRSLSLFPFRFSMSNKTFHRPSKFEDLSDEILMDIFDLLNPALFIYHSFYNLNGRFNRILHDSRLLMSLDLSRLISPSNFAYHCQMMLPNMFKQLIRLRLSNDFKLYEQINVFLRDFRFSQFEFLRQLSLVQIKFQQLSRVLYDILSLKNLIRLDIDTFDACGTSSEEIQYIANTFISQSSTIKVKTKSNRMH